MKTWTFRRPPVRFLVLSVLLGMAATGCDKKVAGTLQPNQPPTVRLTHAPVSSTSREKYSYRMNWIGYDPDGKVDYFVYQTDPADPDVVDDSWIRTTRSDEIIDFDAGVPEGTIDHNATAPGIASAPHVFAIAAVDNQGLLSPTVSRAFFSTTQAPYVAIESPRPSRSAEALVTPSVRIVWNGSDQDGPTGKAVRYVYRLFGRKNPDFPAIDDFISFATGQREEFRMLYAPEFGPSDHCPTCTEWETAPADTPQVRYTNLIPLQQYLFVVTGFDAAGAYDPIFSRSKNMLLMNVSYAGTLGPAITMYNEFFNFTYPTGGRLNDPNRYVRIEVPCNQTITFNWFAKASPGAEMKRYRWVLDLQNLADETPRESLNDWYHWSPWALGNTSATIGPFGPSTHLFFIEAEDDIGLVSLGIIQFTVVCPTFDKDLLIVQDCRLLPDLKVNQVYQSPSGAWPNKAELDTFLYARGGYPWKGAYSYPSNGGPYASTPGIFNGYAYDTLNTRQYLSGIVPLAVLGRYKHVIWYVDRASATRGNAPHNPTSGMVALRFMSGEPTRGAPNTLATFLKQGGSAWVFGGGAAAATLIAWNKSGSDPNVYDSREVTELGPGRFMYDFTHWRSVINIAGQASTGRLNWQLPKFNSQTPSRGYPGAPSYTRLAANAMTLTGRSPGDPEDAPPPLRRPDSFWYQTQYNAEVITSPNFILEDMNGEEQPGGVISTVDTVYIAGDGTHTDRPMMTYYHGNDFRRAIGDPAPGEIATEPARFVFSGFPLWYFKRSQQIALVDWVLQDVWGLPRDGGAPRVAMTSRAVPTTASAARVSAAPPFVPRNRPLAPAQRR